MASAHLVPALEARLRVQDMHHSGVLALKGKGFQHQVVGAQVGELDEAVISVEAPKNIGQRSLADLALELSPVDACVVQRVLSVLFSFQP